MGASVMRWLKWLFVFSKLRRDRRVRQALATARDLSWRQRVAFVSGLARDPRIPRRARLAPLLVAAYIVSPLDLIPDFIPVLGQLDDLAALSLAMRFVQRALPAELLEEHLRRVREEVVS
jgi:uncharacterized membrane protein YkvA (DUF1232 family)